MESPMDVTYMRVIRTLLHFLGSWPYAEFGDYRRTFPLRHHRFIFCLWCMTTTLQILYIKDNINKLSFIEMGHNYITVMLSVICIQRISMPSSKSYREVMKTFVLQMHLLHYKYKSKYALKVYRQVERICSFFCYLNYSQIVLGVILFNGTPLLKNYRAGMFSSHRPDNGTFEHATYFKLPFDYQHDIIGSLAVSIINLIVAYDVATIVAIYDLSVYVIVFHTWGHLKILDHNLRNFPRPEMRPQEGCSSYVESPPWYTPEESQRVAHLLKEYIGHHRLVINFSHKTSKAFGVMLCFYYTFHQVSHCILLLECSTLDPTVLTVYLSMTIYLIQQLIQLSVIFELVGSKSDTLSDAVYSVPWECMRASERKTLLVFLCNAQTPISLKAGGMVPVGVRTMAVVMKTTVSYFIMLRTIDKR